MTSSVVCDHAETLLNEEVHLTVPRVRIQRPAMREGDSRAFAPVFVVDRRPVFRGECAHDRVSGNNDAIAVIHARLDF